MTITTENLDDVLFGFHQAADVVTPGLVATWTRAYPEFADDIRAHAVEIMDMQLLAASASEEPTAAHAPLATPAAAPVPAVDVGTLREAVKAVGSTLREFADGLGIARSIVSDLNAGRIVAGTVPLAFLRLGAERLRLAPDWFEAVVAGSRESGTAAAFKAAAAPEAGRQRTWEEAVHDSDMDPERKAHWLSGDA